MALASQSQDDFSGGIYRGRRAPGTALYDATNALINDEGLPFKRGGSAYKTTSDTAADIIGMAAMTLPIYGPTVIFWTTGDIYVINNPSTPSSRSSTALPRPFARGVGVASAWYAPAATGGANKIVKVADASPIPDATLVTLVEPSTVEYVAAVGSPARLIVTKGNRAWFSGRGTPETIDADDYHELNQNAQIIGADSIDDTAILMTTAGIYAVSNMALDPIDAFGNVQHQVAQVNKDLIVWGDPGVAGWQGTLVIPALDDVYLFNLTGPPVPITGSRGSEYDGGIRVLYRSYVKAGYQPGLATVHRGHYFLPILSGTTLIDVLVCRLDRGFAWTRWSGHAAGGAYVQEVGASIRAPKLYGISARRVTNLSGCFDPVAGNASDADASVADCTIITRDFPTGQQPGFIDRARARYELEDGGTPDPTVAIAFTSDADAGTFTTLTDRGEQGGAAGWGVSDGSAYQWATVGKKRERGRLRITVSGACARFVLRSVELLIRQSGKQ